MSQPSYLPGAEQYNEGETVALITDIYKTLIRLGHYQNFEVQFAPPEGFDIDVSQAAYAGPIDPRILSLMRRLPRPTDSYKAIGVATKPVNYGRPDELAWSRDIHKIDQSQPRHREGYARPTVILITDGQDDAYPLWVLDVADNTMRDVDFELDDQENRREVDTPDGSLLEHYLNWPKENAKSFLRGVLHKYLSADWVPNYAGSIVPVGEEATPQEDEQPGAAQIRYAEIKRTLLEDYKWPGAEFRRDDWLRDAPEMLRAANDAALGLED